MENSRTYRTRLNGSHFFIALTLLMFTLYPGMPTSAEIIETDRRLDWGNAGYPGVIPDVPEVVNVKDFGAKGDGLTDDFAAISAAIAEAPSPGAVFLPEGIYLFRSTIRIKEGIVLRGAGADKTSLICDMGGSGFNCIDILTYQRGDFVSVLDGLHKGSNVIRIEDTTQFNVGDTVEIQQENDPDVMYTRPEWNVSWGDNSVGQFFRVLAIEGDRLILDRPLHMDFNPELHPVIRPNRLIMGVGIEDLRIRRADAGDGSTIQIKNASNSWVRRIESASTYRSHVNITSSMNIEIRDSYFHHSHDYGGGGHGYGTNLSGHTTDCLVENNIFEHLRHSMLVQTGANGNVFGYNYSIDTYANGGSWEPPDISVHGHYPFMNLFEGNIVQEVYSSDYWGPAGPGNTFFRNRVEYEDLNIKDHSHDQNVIGNELTAENNKIVVEPDSQGVLIHGNNIRGEVTWDPSISDRELPASYYLAYKPTFFGSIPWPAIGGDQTIGSGILPAKQRYDAGTPVPPKEPSQTFVDVPPDHWAYEYINILYWQGYIAGCNSDPLMFCPEDGMTRAEGAVFMLRGEYGDGYLPPQPSSQVFSDAPIDEWYGKWANQLFTDGFTAGCSHDPLQFCPLVPHSVAEASVFFVRMKHGTSFEPPDPEHIFKDIPRGVWYEGWVEQAYLDDLVVPCQEEPELKACAEDPITRAMGAYMMVQAKGLYSSEP